MEAGVVAPETSVRVDRNNCGNNLRGEEEKNGNVERCFGDLKLFVDVGFDEPGSANKYGDEIDKHHLVELENFRGERPEKEGSDEE